MSISAADIAAGVATGLATHKITPHVDRLLDDLSGIEQQPLSEADLLHLLHLTLIDMLVFLRNQAAVKHDLYKFVTLYKGMAGPPLIPEHHENRLHFQMVSPVSVLLNCSGSGLGNFNVTLPAGVWFDLEYPDGNSYALDATVATSQQVVWMRETNSDIV